MRSLAFRAYGLDAEIEFDAAFEPYVAGLLPPGRKPPQGHASLRYSVVNTAAGLWRASRGGDEFLAQAQEPELVADVLDVAIRRDIAALSTEYTFIHAGTVGYKGRAIVVAGRSFAGKSTLVHSLLGLGATYLSDEFALLDDEGKVHAYPRPITLRRNPLAAPADSEAQVRTESRPLPIGLFVVTQYVPGGHWAPVELSRARGIMAVFEHVVSERSETALERLRLASGSARFFVGERGDAEETAAALLRAASGEISLTQN